jgi:hypothetical protein
MTRKELLQAGLAPARGATHSPVQVQKLFFLIDRSIPEEVGGPHFNFGPYNYGPFDLAVYMELDALAAQGKVEILFNGRWQEYRLTENGQAEGERLLNGLIERARNYLVRLSAFVRSLTFTQLVSAIYRAYPEMRENSVFQD